MHGLKKHISHKNCKTKSNLPWITPTIKRLIKQRDRSNIKRRKTRAGNLVRPTHKLDEKLRALKAKIQKESRNSHWQHVEFIILPELNGSDLSSSTREPIMWALHP